MFLDRSETSNYAAFAEVEYRVLPYLRLIGGGRYDRETRETSSSTTFTSVLPNSSLATKATYNAFLPKMGIVYDFTDDMSLGFTVQRGYRGGGAGLNNFTGETFEFDPEYTWNYEVSLRSQWLENRLTVNANAFYTDWNDQQVTVAGPSGNALDTTIENAGASRVFGGELELRALAADDLELFAAVGYADTRFDDFISGGQQLAGNEFPNAPRITRAIGGTYYFPYDVSLAIDASYTDDSFGDVENTPDEKNDSRFLTNVRLGYDSENWGVLAYVNNLFDKDYVAQSTGLTPNEIVPGDPRTFGVIGQIRF